MTVKLRGRCNQKRGKSFTFQVYVLSSAASAEKKKYTPFVVTVSDNVANKKETEKHLKKRVLICSHHHSVVINMTKSDFVVLISRVSLTLKAFVPMATFRLYHAGCLNNTV